MYSILPEREEGVSPSSVLKRPRCKIRPGSSEASHFHFKHKRVLGLFQDSFLQVVKDDEAANSVGKKPYGKAANDIQWRMNTQIYP